MREWDELECLTSWAGFRLPFRLWISGERAGEVNYLSLSIIGYLPNERETPILSIICSFVLDSSNSLTLRVVS